MKNKNKRGAKTGLCSFLRGVKRVSTKTALSIVTGKEQQDKKKKGVKSLQTYDNGASPLAIPARKSGGLNVPKV